EVDVSVVVVERRTLVFPQGIEGQHAARAAISRTRDACRDIDRAIRLLGSIDDVDGMQTRVINPVLLRGAYDVHRVRCQVDGRRARYTDGRSDVRRPTVMPIDCRRACPGSVSGGK